jgi:hypothetical protein
VGVIAYYARVTAAELDGLVKEPAFIRQLARRVDRSGPRFLDIDKAWDRIFFILDEWIFPVDVIFGENLLPGPDDWGPPGYLTVEQVREAAEEFFESGTAPVSTFFATSWPEPENTHPRVSLDHALQMSYVGDYYNALAAFIQAAAHAGDAVVMWRY